MIHQRCSEAQIFSRTYSILRERENVKARRKLFSTILGQICTDSQKEIARAAGWKVSVRDHDVMEPLKSIVATHGVPQSTDPGQQKLDARDKYNSRRQGSFEDTADYFIRFNECLRMLRAVVRRWISS